MQNETNPRKSLQSKVLWLAVTSLIVLSAGYAAMSRTPMRAGGSPAAIQSEIQQSIAPLAAKPEPASFRPPAAIEAKHQVAIAKVKPEAQPQTEKITARKSSCNCETAELDLPDMCPDASCQQCKVKCGIMAH